MSLGGSSVAVASEMGFARDKMIELSATFETMRVSMVASNNVDSAGLLAGVQAVLAEKLPAISQAADSYLEASQAP